MEITNRINNHSWARSGQSIIYTLPNLKNRWNILSIRRESTTPIRIGIPSMETSQSWSTVDLGKSLLWIIRNWLSLRKRMIWAFLSEVVILTTIFSEWWKSFSRKTTTFINKTNSFSTKSSTTRRSKRPTSNESKGFKSYKWNLKTKNLQLLEIWIEEVLSLKAPIIELSLIHIWRCRRYAVCRSRWSPYH